MKQERHCGSPCWVSVPAKESHHILAVGHRGKCLVPELRARGRSRHFIQDLRLFWRAISPGSDAGLAEIVHGSPGKISENIRIVL